MKRIKQLAKRQRQSGFSLVEIAIVLVVVGLFIGGVLRGQELIASARVRNVIDQVRAVQVAYYGFQDRYNALPGDLTTEQALTVNINAAPGLVSPGDGWVPIDDSQQFFNNVAHGGFIVCTPCRIKQTTASNPTADFSPTNLYGQPIGFAYPSVVPNTNVLGAYYWSTAANEGTKAMVTTGGSIDSKSLAEMDRKIDDGSPSSGQFRFGDVVPSTSGVLQNPPLDSCLTTDTTGAYTLWKVITGGQCQGVLLL
jgi:prepilin-type N-terminal cleavage/methylation domain-containing protein